MKLLSLFFLAAVFTPSSIWGFDRDQFTQHLREALNLDIRLPVKIDDPVESEFEGFMEIKARVGSNDLLIYLSEEKQKYILANVFDLTESPDQSRAAKINLKNARAKGSKKAIVQIIEYSDLQCPYCKKAHSLLEEELFENYSEKEVRWVFKHYPLRNHKWAEKAAVAAECAGNQKEEAFWKMTELYFENMKEINPENIDEKTEEFVDELGLKASRFSRCIESDKMGKRVNEHKIEAKSLGVSSIPTFYINGRMKRGVRTFEDLKVLIDEKLEEAKKK